MAGVDEVEVVVAHAERVTVRLGDVFVKLDADPGRLAREVEAMSLAPVPTPRIVWHREPAVALVALPGAAIARLGQPSSASPAAWTAAGVILRTLHDAPLPTAPGLHPDEHGGRLDAACRWLLDNAVLPAELIRRNRELAEAALRPWDPAFIHGDLQVAHVFVDGDVVTGVLDWSEAAQGDPLYDLAILTLGHPEHLDDVLAGYGTQVDLDVIRGWWSPRSLSSARWLIEHGFDPDTPGCEFDVLRRQGG